MIRWVLLCYSLIAWSRPHYSHCSVVLNELWRILLFYFIFPILRVKPVYQTRIESEFLCCILVGPIYTLKQFFQFYLHIIFGWRKMLWRRCNRFWGTLVMVSIYLTKANLANRSTNILLSVTLCFHKTVSLGLLDINQFQLATYTVSQ